VIDLASTLKQAEEEHKVFVCSECGKDLVLDATYRLRNPYGGEGYYCPNINKCSLFGKVLDISLKKLNVKPRPIKGAISNLRDSSQESIIETVPQDRGITIAEDEYEKYNPEPMEVERLKMEGAQIINSTTYYPASNTTITKRSLTPQEIAEEKGYSVQR
jgi:hypothetical protein